ncbi:MAG: 2'-5' RNA ligase family protein [Bryobacteraceae bacterium]
MNSYAVVAYIPDPLGKFLDDLRKELVPNCLPHAHVTLLPPRPISGEVAAAAEIAAPVFSSLSPFIVELSQVEIFAVTEVIYLAVDAGREELRRVHEILNVGPFAYRETFPYHPHVTLAQDLAPGQVEDLARTTRKRWAECPYPRHFLVETVYLVQNTVHNRWVDLETFSLGGIPVRS